MNERGGELYHIIGELLLQSETNLMLQLLQSGKNQLLMQQAIYSATVAVDIRRPHFGCRECAFSRDAGMARSRNRHFRQRR